MCRNITKQTPLKSMISEGFAKDIYASLFCEVRRLILPALYDNACVESFFGLLKNECIYRAKPQTIQAAAELVEEYIYFYNFDCIQLSTKRTPIEMRLGTADNWCPKFLST